MKVGVIGNPHHLAKRKKNKGRGSLLWYYTNIMMFYVQ
jgi:hypothetical protein